MTAQPLQAGPRDAALPHLAQALDGAAMASVFDDLLRPGATWSVRGCEVERVKYRPQRNCSVSYRLQLHHRGSDRVIHQGVAARVCNGDSARRAARAGQGVLAPSPAGPALRHLPDLDMLTWWWPNDAKLSAPRVLADAALLRTEVLPQVLGWLGGGTLEAHAVHVAQYVPEQRLCARVDLAWRTAKRTHSASVYAKTSLEPSGEEAHAILKALRQSPAARAGRLHTPLALGWQPGSGLHWQLAAPGVALLDLPAAQAAALAPALGAQLAALHATPVDVARAITAEALAVRLDEVCELLGAALPGSADALQLARLNLARGLQHLHGQPFRTPATLHGDLHPRNLLVDGAHLTLIDLDGLRRGPALLELGAWVADGIYRAHLEGAAPMRDRAAWQSLLQAYADAGGHRPDAAALAWAAAWNLLTQRAFRCVVNLKPGRWAVAPALVACAASLAEGGSL